MDTVLQLLNASGSGLQLSSLLHVASGELAASGPSSRLHTANFSGVRAWQKFIEI